jgi:hypothetical protein
MTDAAAFFFPGPEGLSRIGCGRVQYKWNSPQMEQPLLFRVGAAFIFCRRTCKPEKTKKLRPLTIDGRQHVVR